MRKLILSAGVALASGLICFFLSVAFLAFVLLFIRAVSHTLPDMTLTYKAALPVAILASLCGFIVTLVRSFRSSARTSASQK